MNRVRYLPLGIICLWMTYAIFMGLVSESEGNVTVPIYKDSITTVGPEDFDYHFELCHAYGNSGSPDIMIAHADKNVASTYVKTLGPTEEEKEREIDYPIWGSAEALIGVTLDFDLGPWSYEDAFSQDGGCLISVNYSYEKHDFYDNGNKRSSAYIFPVDDEMTGEKRVTGEEGVGTYYCFVTPISGSSEYLLLFGVESEVWYSDIDSGPIDASAAITINSIEIRPGSCVYDFDYRYKDDEHGVVVGDLYNGAFIAPWFYAKQGDVKTTFNETGYEGYYEILYKESLWGWLSTDTYPNKDGEVYVFWYADVETGKCYTPVNFVADWYEHGIPQGTNYLGSEYGYIIQEGVDEYYFGGGYYEADGLAYKYDFNFTYGNGDFYTGAVYLPEGYQGYYRETQDENGQTGYYNITGVNPETYDISKIRQVYVDSYYDKESDETFTPVHAYASDGTTPNPVGTDSLGSEHDYIIHDDFQDFYFGNGPDGKFYEADLLAQFEFSFTYLNGDNYSGTTYAIQDEEHNGLTYEPGNRKYVKDQNGHDLGYYELIGGVSYLEDVWKKGEVFVDRYFDFESGKTFTPVHTYGPDGITPNWISSDYLGSEMDYIIWGNKTANYETDQDCPKFKFGYDQKTGKFYEADAPGDYVAVLFAGGGGQGSNSALFYDHTLREWQVTTGPLGYAPGDVFVLFGDGLDPAVDLANGTSADWRTITQTAEGNVYAGTKGNLQSLLTALGGTDAQGHPILGEGDTFYFWCGDHGANTIPPTHTAYIIPWTDKISIDWKDMISDTEFAGWVAAVKAGHQAYVLTECYSGGVAEDLELGDGRFVAWAADWYEPATNDNNDFAAAWANALANGLTYTREAGRAAIENDDDGPFSMEQDRFWIDRPGWMGANFRLARSGVYRPIAAYDFQFKYGNGDYYSGQAYASIDETYSSKAYYEDYLKCTWYQPDTNGDWGTYKIKSTWDTPDENGQVGAYKVTPTLVYTSDTDKSGQVFVKRYHDAETGSNPTPLKYTAGHAAGSNYLGSEDDYIIRTDKDECRFGKGFYEADVVTSERPRPTPQPHPQPRPPGTSMGFSQVYYQQVDYLTKEDNAR